MINFKSDLWTTPNIITYFFKFYYVTFFGVPSSRKTLSSIYFRTFKALDFFLFDKRSFYSWITGVLPFIPAILAVLPREIRLRYHFLCKKCVLIRDSNFSDRKREKRFRSALRRLAASEHNHN